MKIIGFQSGHDVSYCVLENGVPTLHNEWERFSREKSAQGDGLKFLFSTEEGTGVLDNIKYFTHGNPRTRFGLWAYKNKPETGEFPCYNQDEDTLMRSLAPYQEVSHHLSHAANAFFSSNFKDALIITLDGGGWELFKDYSFMEVDTATAATLHLGEDNKINSLHVCEIKEFNFGALWDIVTRDVLCLPWAYPEGPATGTVMAMAAQGEFDDQLIDAIKSCPYDVEAITFLKSYVEHEEEHRFNVAATLQGVTETAFHSVLTAWIRLVKEKEGYEVKRLCLAGGVALNSVMVGKIYDWFPEIEIYIPPVPYDSGLSIGSAQYKYHHVLNYPRVKWEGNSSPYLGRAYSKEFVMAAIKEYNLEYQEVTDMDVIDLISKDDNVISVFGGGSESGRRALGNRSILADPRSKTMKAVINEKVKHRQSFRPFAPSILREEVANWFVRDVNSPYMTCVIKFKEEVVDKVPAVCHSDNTARLQTVTKKDNLWYYNFIKMFGEKTGVPMLLNTSFNDREPIVETPNDAISCFQGTSIDYLYFFDYGILIKKQ